MTSNAIAKIEFDPEQMAVIEAQFFPAGATRAEQQYCLGVARELGLNPITKEIHFVARRQKIGDRWTTRIEPMVGRDGFLSIAHRSGQLAGMESMISIQEVPRLEGGLWVMRPELVAECVVWRKDSLKSFSSQVPYGEYCQKTSDGQVTKFWAEKAMTMLKKVAESQALRKAFNIHGVYCPEEMGAGFETDAGEIVGQTIEAEIIRTPPDKSHLTIVQPSSPQPDPPPLSQQETQPAPGPSAADWPDPPESPSANPASDGRVSEVIAILENKHIPYDIDMETGIISAKSFHERQLLKDAGFRWNAGTKSWVFRFEPDPF